MKVGIYGQFYHKDSGQYIEELLHALDKENFEVVIEKNFLKLIHLNTTVTNDYKNRFGTFEKLDASFDLFLA